MYQNVFSSIVLIMNMKETHVYLIKYVQCYDYLSQLNIYLFFEGLRQVSLIYRLNINNVNKCLALKIKITMA